MVLNIIIIAEFLPIFTLFRTHYGVCVIFSHEVRSSPIGRCSSEWESQALVDTPFQL